MTNPTNEHREQARHKRHDHIDDQRLQEMLNSLPECPTEEEAETILQACGTSGKEVVNGFIERLLKERSEAIAALSSHDTEVREALEELAKRFDYAAWKGFNQSDSEFEKGYKHAMEVAARVVRESALYAKLQPKESSDVIE